MDEKIYNVYINEKGISKRLDPESSLSEIRKKLNLSSNYYFYRGDCFIEQKDENTFSIKEIEKIENDYRKIYINSREDEPPPPILVDITPDISLPTIIVKLNEKSIDILKVDLKDNLNNLRCRLKSINNNDLFLSENKIIDPNEETKIQIKDILIKDTIYMKTKKNNGEKYVEDYIIYLNGKIIERINLSPNNNLIFVRKFLKEKISENDLFKYKDMTLGLEKEYYIIVNDIAIENKIYIENKEEKLNSYNIIEGSHLIRKEGDIAIYKYPSKKFEDNDLINCKTIMVVGQTGSGKTTLLNSLVNFVVGIEFKDPIRYIIIEETKGKIVNEANSQTSDVNVYYIQRHGIYPPLRIIDTPGFGDTRGIKYDREITKKIKKLFEKDIDSLNAICFVAQSSNARLTTNQKFIFSEIMELFGKDVAEIFVPMLTFCDGKEPLIIDGLLSNEAFLTVLPHLKEPWYLKFNNSAIFASIKDKFSEIFWEIGMTSFSIFLDKISFLPRKSLMMSKEVLEKREILENSILVLKNKLDTGLTLIESYKKDIKYIEEKKKNVDKNKNYKIKIQTKKPVIRKEYLRPGTYVTSCLNCNRTCNYRIMNNKENYENGYDRCRKCPNKCYMRFHKKTPYKLIYITKEVEETDEELKKKYFKAKSDLSEAQQIINGKEKELKSLEINCLDLQEKIKDNMNELKNIALYTNTHESAEDYLKMMIKNEEYEKKEGYLDRIQGLKELQKQYEIIKKLYNEQRLDTEFEQFKKDYITKKKNQFNGINEENNCIIF